jgi:hypothetical protein
MIEKIIVSTWAKAGIFPMDTDLVLRKMKKYSNPEPEDELPPHEAFYSTPRTIRHSIQLGEALRRKIDPQLSSPTRRAMQSYRRGCE